MISPQRQFKRAGEPARRFMSATVGTLFPATCAGCGVSGTWMCSACLEKSPGIDQSRVCLRCGQPHDSGGSDCARCVAWPDALQSCRSAFVHTDAPRRAIHRLKYSNEPSRAEWCALQLQHLLRNKRGHDSLTLIPVPLHGRRLRQRGYNQALLLCQWLATFERLPAIDALVRVRPTSSQVGLDADARAENLKDAIAPRLPLAGKNVVLIDDVVTTGSTLVASALACQRAGAASVCSLTFATGQ